MVFNSGEYLKTEPMVSWIAVRKRVAIKRRVKPGDVYGDLQKAYTIGVLLIGRVVDRILALFEWIYFMFYGVRAEYYVVNL